MDSQRNDDRTQNPLQTEFLEGLVRSLPQRAGLLLDAEGTIVAFGPTLPDFFPRPRERLRTHVADLPPRVLGESISKLWAECRRSGEPARADIVFCADPAHEKEPISASLRVARHPDCETACVVTVRDSSRDKGRVQDLLDHIETLERRTKEWEVAMQTAGHDMCSCLAALRGFIDLTLREGNLPGAAVDHLHRAREIAAQVGEIAERVQASAGETRPGVSVVLGALGHRLFRALHAAHPEVLFTWSVQAPDLSAKLPTHVLWEVLWNLLSNSVKYRSRDRALRIDLKAGLEGGEVWVEVRDNGRGIRRREEDAVFRQGWRGSNAEGTPGSGLGLFSARQLLETYGGRIWAEPCLEGATVRLAFPGSLSVEPTSDNGR